MSIHIQGGLTSGSLGSARRGFRFFSFLLIALCHAFVIHATERAPQMVPTTTELIVPVSGGDGGAEFAFVLKPSVRPSSVIVGDALSTAGIVPASDITVTISNSSETNIMRVGIKVKTQRSLDPGKAYKSKLFFLWPSREFSTVDFSILPAPPPAIEIRPSKIEEVVGWSRLNTTAIKVLNTGQVPIEQLTLECLGLTDAVTKRRVDLPTISMPAALAPGRERVLRFALPVPRSAGNYTGDLYISALGHGLGSIPLTIVARGPLGGRPLPPLLFAAVALGGMGLSSLLDKWFAGGGLARSQGILSLYYSRDASERLASQIANWERAHSPLPKTTARVALDTARVNEALADIRGLASSDLRRVAAEGEAAVKYRQTFWLHLETATRQARSPGALVAVATRLDALEPTDLPSYTQALTAVVTAVDAIGGEGPSLPPPASTIRRHIALMSFLSRVVLIVVITVSAFLLFYVRHFSFGTASDYAAVLLWALGLTQTGSQLLARGVSSWARTNYGM